MENKEPNRTFSYSYSAKEQEEIRTIRQKYEPKEEDKMEQLRRLDAGVTKKGSIVSLCIGIISCLVLGGGMSCVMVGEPSMFIPGLLVGILGLIGVTLAYPVYAHITKKERERLAPEIIRLSDELMK